MLNICLIGCGKISNSHIKALNTITKAKIVAVCDISQENLKKAVEQTGAKAYTDYHIMLKDFIPDLAIINLPHSLHNQCTCFCAKKKVNVFLEKPMGINSIDCQEIINECKRNQVMLWIGHLQRYRAENIKVKQLIDSGKYGALIGIHETRNLLYISKDRPNWFLDKKIAGGGIMMNLGAHTLDKIKFYTESEIENAEGFIKVLDGESVESSVQAIVKTKNGVVATINLIGFTCANTHETILYLTKGEIRIKWDYGITACGVDGVFEEINVAPVPAMTLQMCDVIDTLLSKKPPKVGGNYGKDIVRAIECIYKNGK